MSDARPGPVAPDVFPYGGIDVRQAFDVYVYGRSRNLDPEAKRGVVARKRDTGGTPERDAAAVATPPRGIVSVPERADLRYDRNAGTWRDRTSPDGGG